jgi:hypothetical protein
MRNDIAHFCSQVKSVDLGYGRGVDGLAIYWRAIGVASFVHSVITIFAGIEGELCI